MRTVYLDHAATSWPKSESVLSAVREAVLRAGGNPGRGSHPLSDAAAELLYDARREAADFFDGVPERTVFTPGATWALNTAIRGLAPRGCRILYDNFAHNAVVRPVRAMTDAGLCTSAVYDASGSDGEILAVLENCLTRDTAVVIATHQSNICSRVLPVREIGRFCRERGLLFIVDGAQSAGHLPLSMKEDGIDALCLPGHKGLLGLPGAGVLLLSERCSCRPLVYGGAGILSLEPGMPEELPERLEPGTLPLPAIASLAAGIRLIRKYGPDRIRCWENALSRMFTANLPSAGRYRTAGDTGGSVVSILHERMSPAEVGAALAERGICVRTGYHCAPLAHRTIGTAERGTVRVSFGASNTPADIERILNVLNEIDEF